VAGEPYFAATAHCGQAVELVAAEAALRGRASHVGQRRVEQVAATCFVAVNDAAKAAYYRTSGKRVEVKVGSVYGFNTRGYSPRYYHCSFTDGSCPACTNCQLPPDSFFTDIANTVQKFVNAAFYTGWTRSALVASTTTPVTFYIDGDQP